MVAPPPRLEFHYLNNGMEVRHLFHYLHNEMEVPPFHYLNNGMEVRHVFLYLNNEMENHPIEVGVEFHNRSWNGIPLFK